MTARDHAEWADRLLGEKIHPDPETAAIAQAFALTAIALTLTGEGQALMVLDRIADQVAGAADRVAFAAERQAGMA